MSSITAFVETEAMQVGSAIVDILNDGTISIPQVAKRSYLPSIVLETAGDASVLVAVTGRSLRRQQRSTVRHTIGTIPSRKAFARFVKAEIGISKKFQDYSNLQAADPIVKVAEEVADLLAAIRIEASSALHAYPENPGGEDAVNHAPIYDPELWKANMQITSIVTVHYRLVDAE